MIAICISLAGISIVTMNTFAFGIRCAGPFAAYGLGLVVPKATKNSENPFLFNDTFENNITMYGDYPREEVDSIIEGLHLTKLASEWRGDLGDSGSNISGGEKERIAIARVLLRKPQILVFDEPTAALNPDVRDAINDIIFGVEGYLRIVITHDQRTELLSRFDGGIKLR